MRSDNPYLSQISAVERQLVYLEEEEARIAESKANYPIDDPTRISLEEREIDILQQKANLEQQMADLKRQALEWEKNNPTKPNQQ